MSEAPPEHVRPDQLFALLWANKDKRPPNEGEGADPELARMFDDMDERFDTPPPPEHRLGPETCARLWEHAIACPDCRLLLIEDGPGARPPKTAAQLEQEQLDRDEQRRKQVIKFWIDLIVGTAFFAGAFVTLQIIRGAKVVDQAETTLRAVRDKPLDPRYVLFAILILGASWFLAEAYTIARDLWIDFTAWKRAVPIIGEKWVERDKRKKRGG
ncbi:MAG: hypothetical protein D6731_17410 [Planctomycetota bacterium]|nr:MAG: hypothetical protein D6731_17410 [Planctomycetota bacterium]